ncbi:glycoside hydrolase family 99-like domain-containing protein [Mucilaginibacter sp. UR6-1]|uniref:glycosyltransferase WbsX family protein n=1 Tax=Mucilaginibacter sp. UR6-1 TaxID=1435643 RepID=UPI001E2C1A38|nr:glycoside hydrolase family 99-like domain-containing protein [Mucilaginibacter sp. UR6-1]MCC8409597.1 glycoside hydrolase family 99-like domain-containing protein [Mucilaginibacter sp. UR6-1]
MNKKARVIAFYLPQFYPIPENDNFWGKGFTEWTNVAAAKPLYKGHKQPVIPGDLSFYDLRLPEIREAQAKLAKEHGVEAFCYWHYWFGRGRRILDRVFDEVVKSGTPDFPFCLGWGNETWSGIWHGSPGTVLIKQEYPDVKDFEDHFNTVLPAFLDKRYLTVDGKPLFLIYRPGDKDFDIKLFVETWQRLAKQNGLPGVYFVGVLNGKKPSEVSMDALVSNAISPVVTQVEKKKYGNIQMKARRKFPLYNSFFLPRRISYKDFIAQQEADGLPEGYLPNIVPRWDNTPRSKKRGVVLMDSTSELFEVHVNNVIKSIQGKPEQERIAFLKSWNEWAEGNYIEPDRETENAYLEVLKKCIED